METDHLKEKDIITIDHIIIIIMVIDHLIEILKTMEIDHLTEMDRITDHLIEMVKTTIDHLIEMDKDNLDLEEDHLMKEELKKILKI